MVTGKTYNVLFFCTGNSARSILFEALLEHWGRGRLKAYSAGGFPKGAAHRLAFDLLEKSKLSISRLRGKSWAEFAKPGASEMDFVFTICDQAAREVCPVWPGSSVTTHRGMPDPAAVEGTEAEKNRAFRIAFQALETRIKLFTSLRLEALDRLAVKREVDEIGRRGAAPRLELS